MLPGGLPQRYPEAAFDAVLERSDDGLVVSRAVRADAPWCVGHFPGEPILPGVLQIEAMAQAVAAWVGEDRRVELIGMDRVRFRRAVRPGDELVVSVVQTSERGPQQLFKGTASVDGQPSCQATLRVFVHPA